MSTPPYTFDADDADVILRAPLYPWSDEFKDFHTHKTILSIASSLLRDMFSIPQPPQHATGDVTLPIVQIVESADVFETFLRLVYPIEPPAVHSLQLVDNLFQLADKYMASVVHAKLKPILVSPPFLRDDPIWVYAIACRANLDEEAGLAIPYTFRIDLIQEIPSIHLQKMTAETYNQLLLSHAARRAELISVLNRATLRGSVPSGCSCGKGKFYSRLRKDICLAIWERPFLDRQRLDLCLANFTGMSKSRCGLGPACRVSARTISTYFTGILEQIGKLE